MCAQVTTSGRSLSGCASTLHVLCGPDVNRLQQTTRAYSSPLRAPYSGRVVPRELRVGLAAQVSFFWIYRLCSRVSPRPVAWALEPFDALDTFQTRFNSATVRERRALLLRFWALRRAHSGATKHRSGRQRCSPTKKERCPHTALTQSSECKTARCSSHRGGTRGSNLKFELRMVGVLQQCNLGEMSSAGIGELSRGK